MGSEFTSFREMHAEVDSFVAIDIEPGGADTPLGHIGVAEVIDNKVTANFSCAFESPVHRQRRNKHGVDYMIYGLPLSQRASFDEALIFIDAFIDQRRVLAYNAGYDKAALNKLTTEVDMPPVQWNISDVLRIARKLWPMRPMPLQWLTVSLELLDEDDIALRKMHNQLEPCSSKVILKNAQEDAWACAQVALRAQAETGTNNIDDLLKSLGFR